MVHIKVVIPRRRREIGQPSADAATALHVLPRVNEVNLSLAPQARRANARFVATDSGSLQRQRKEEVGISQHIVIEEIARPRTKVIEVEAPSPQRNDNAELMLFIPLSR